MADELYSAGARLERAADLAKVNRLLKWDPKNPGLLEMKEFLQTRRARYDKKPGGLGRK